MGGFSQGVNDSSQNTLSIGQGLSTSLMQILQAEDIVPGSAPSYETCKALYIYHPLGSKMADAPINMAQSQKREIQIPDAPPELVEEFEKEWGRTGKVGADVLIHNAAKTARIYGISAIVVGSRGESPSEPLDIWKLHEQELYFNILDPLNTAGSLVLNQDPNAPDYQKPNTLYSGSVTYHPSRSCVTMNEQPIYIAFTGSAFGFVGRSVYQRALFPLKSFIQSMITDDIVTTKAALLVAKLKSPGSITDQRSHYFWQFKRNAIKSAQSGNVLSIGVDETLESVDLKNLREAAEFARNDILKNIATAANMPANMINNETLAEGFGEGIEDAKQIARYIDRVRIEMQPLYQLFDKVVMHKAWNPDFYASIQKKYPEYERVAYETAFYGWEKAFKFTWPNLLVEPDSQLVERDAKIIESARAIFEVMAPKMDQGNVAMMASWLADIVNSRKLLISSPLSIDVDAMAAYQPPANIAGAEPNF